MDIKEININEQDLISIGESDLNTFSDDQFSFFIQPGDFDNYNNGFNLYIDEKELENNNLLLNEITTDKDTRHSQIDDSNSADDSKTDNSLNT